MCEVGILKNIIKLQESSRNNSNKEIQIKITVHVMVTIPN